MKKTLLIIGLITLLQSTAMGASWVSQVNDWIGGQLASDSQSAYAYALLLLGGFAASLLPCVYPLYPITINILKARGDAQHKYWHPTLYFFGIVSMYFIFGIVAGLTGGAFNEILRLPLTNIIIAIVLLLLALSSAELLHIPLFSGGQHDVQQQGSWGTFVMGLSAGLLSSACVGPVVVSILIGIAANSAGVSISTIVSASSKLLAFGIGVGMPFLLLGVIGAKLPKAGSWMKYVQYIFALLIIYFAYGYLEKGLLGYNFSENSTPALTLAASLVIAGIYQLQKKDLLPHYRMQNALWGLSAVVGSALLFGALNPSGGSIAGLPNNVASINQVVEQKGNLNWYIDKDAAYQAAQQKGKLVFLDFHGDWCTNCKAFQKMTQDDTELNEALQNAVLYKVYDTSEEFKRYKEDPRFPELKIGLPFFVITDTDGNMLYKTSDFQKADEIVMFLQSEM